VKSGIGLFALVTALASAAPAQTPPAPTKVGIIHIQNAIISTKEGQKAVGELEGRAAPKKKELERKQSEIAALRDQLNKSSSVGSEEAKQKLMRDIDAKTKQFNREVEDAQTELDQDQNKLLNELGGRMFAVIDKYAKDNGYAIILDVSSQQTPVLFASTSIDITKEVIALYDKNAPGPTAPPATGAAPPTTTAPTSPAITRPTAPGTARPGTVAPGTARPVTPAPKPGTAK
jgi:outer membrane protein